MVCVEFFRIEPPWGRPPRTTPWVRPPNVILRRSINQTLQLFNHTQGIHGTQGKNTMQKALYQITQNDNTKTRMLSDTASHRSLGLGRTRRPHSGPQIYTRVQLPIPPGANKTVPAARFTPGRVARRVASLSNSTR